MTFFLLHLSIYIYYKSHYIALSKLFLPFFFFFVFAFYIYQIVTTLSQSTVMQVFFVTLKTFFIQLFLNIYQIIIPQHPIDPLRMILL